MDKQVVRKIAAVMVIAALQLHCAHGQFTRAPLTFIVGDAMGWTVPANGAVTYTAWATDKTFLVGDILQFNFVTGNHTVATLSTREQFDSCTTSNTLQTFRTGPQQLKLDLMEDYYFICTFPGHCNSGQKLSVSVTGVATPSVFLPPSFPSSTSSAPSSSVGVMGFFVSLLTTTIVAFFL
ncbi:hypothetical protein NE237_024823 [Protea cynaroides]|uniref:Phytocyanin domain-containing protein n=1 Tax=Protea cynaroides TaxID=273540 RepID=A0A9Q0H0R4_9MAGN|nr:hypothetical protein NE237_024823 [Protea cynaroides]